MVEFFNRENSDKLQISLIVIGIGFLVFALITIKNILWLTDYYLVQNRAIETKGVITEKYIKEGVGTTNYGVFVSYKTIGGKKRKGSYLISYKAYKRYKNGDIIEILYSNKDPKKSILSKNSVALRMKIFSTALSIPLALLMLLILQGSRNR